MQDPVQPDAPGDVIPILGASYPAADIEAWDRTYVWHPFTQMQDYTGRDPVVIVEGDGVRVRDTRGRWYYDGVASVWLNVHGHRVPALDAAIREQLTRIAHSTLLGQGNAVTAVLAHHLAGITPPGLTRFFFSDSGAAAVEVALKMAVQYWANQGQGQRTRILGFTSNYHGDTLGAMAVAPDETFHWPFLSYLPPEPRVPYPHCYRCPLGRSRPGCGLACLGPVEEALAQEGDRLAAVIIEPVQGAGGIIPAPPGYLAGLRELCDRYGVLLIVDEVATGFGRTGRLWGVDHDGVVPDILCLGKGITGGYLPLSATVAGERIYAAFLGEVGAKRALYHGHSYAGNALAAAAALASLRLLTAPGFLEGVAAKAETLGGALEPLRGLPYVGDVRQLGLMAGIELVQDRVSRRGFPYGLQAGWVVADRARARGLLIRPIGNVVIFMPPLASTPAELGEMTAILTGAVAEAQEALAALAGRG
ncbi:L-lysine-8-amino-7-oxononanoate aminotransferase [Candidatus Hydrogenisulfobacillus filiaventi]|uniref:Adenosylmethionine-8-amino-7-oxononanoate aminotransferase n=1 Tax=Candidatus Hydrogenisulfobacillus filiaventi TaxID=2707344 RepID=A0A6F8ZKN7_9FIRM|nr:adenosylmethionine--8-amino-7-oxononanoate transaminase [Bacillota bacterium]CAB1130025.1 L-lysine-8-amino-7-oxononanoate aminotransferase [Candidatus Hydrogenisulfobacillus filiaventi]